MTLDHVQIRSYFAPPARSYWRWTDGGRVATWKDELTIAFREELEFVLWRLAPSGLPPLGSVLLLLAACRDNWEEPPNRRTLLHSHLGLLYGGGYSDLLTEVLTGLGQVYQIRDQHRRTAQKAALAAALFNDAPGRHAADKSKKLAERFRGGLSDEETEWKPESALDDLLHDLGCLRWGLKRFPFDKADLLLETGLDEVPEPAPVEPPPPSSARELIAALQDDPELGGVARLAQLLLAAVQLPRALSDPEELPIGGVSDIANRGQLDRLLLSELANDDLTLSVRLAMNEALYLRRESPPRTPPRRRRLLLDAGLRTWGVPRIFVAAVGLAVAAKTDEKIRVEAFRSERGAAVPVDLQSAAGIKTHLAALDHTLHPAAAVAALTISGRPGNATEGVPYSAVRGPAIADEETDLIVVTTHDTLADADFQRKLREADVSGLYLAAVDRDGRFELHQKGLRGSKLICRAKFDLDDCLKPRPARPKLLDSRSSPELPAIFREPRFPLRLSCPIELGRSWYVYPGNVVSLTKDGCLLLWDGNARGGRLIAEGLPAGSIQWCSSRWQGDRLDVIVGKRSQYGLRAVQYDRSADESRVVTLRLDQMHPQEVIGVSGGLVLVLFPDQTVAAVSQATGETVCGHSLVEHVVRQGRFIKCREGGRVSWRAMAPLGAVAYHPVMQESEGRQLIALFDAAGFEGPLAITSQGEVLDPATGKAIDIQRGTYRGRGLKGRPPYAVAGISRDGMRVALRAFSDDNGPTRIVHLFLDLRTRQCHNLNEFDAALLERPIREFAQPRTLHAKFRAIGVSADGELTLISRRGQHWPILLLRDEVQRALRFPAQPRAPDRQKPLQHLQEFRSIESFGRGYSLEVADWPGGSRAWLDGRGLLHLRSASSDCCEATIVLCDGSMGGWLANGETFGETYWLDSATLAAQSALELVFKPFIGHLA